MIKKIFSARSLLAFLSVAAILTSAGCSGKGNNDSKKETETGSTAAATVPPEAIKHPITFSVVDDSDKLSGEDPTADPLFAADPTAPSELQTQYGGDDNTNSGVVPSQPGQGDDTEDETGKTDSGSQLSGSGSGTDSEDQPQQGQNSQYTKNIVKNQAYWFDLSKNRDFLFEGEFISLKFRIKDNVPEGTYPVNITETDFSNYGSETKEPETVIPDSVINGSVTVSDRDISAEDSQNNSGFTVFADNVSGKCGDEVTVNLRMKNNPGMCAMILVFEYDSGALELLESSSAGEFKQNASPDIGLR